MQKLSEFYKNVEVNKMEQQTVQFIYVGITLLLTTITYYLIKKYKLIKKYIIILSIGVIFAAYITMVITFIAAFLTPTKTISVFINKHNEAYFELLLIMISLFCFPQVIKIVIVGLKNNWRNTIK